MMKYRHLGKTGLKVSEIGFGAEWLQGKTLEESKELIDYCQLNIGNKKTEEFHILYLDTKCKLIKGCL